MSTHLSVSYSVAVSLSQTRPSLSGSFDDSTPLILFSLLSFLSFLIFIVLLVKLFTLLHMIDLGLENINYGS